MRISGETARHELSHLNPQCLQKPLIAFGSERVKDTALRRMIIRIIMKDKG